MIITLISESRSSSHIPMLRVNEAHNVHATVKKKSLCFCLLRSDFSFFMSAAEEKRGDLFAQSSLSLVFMSRV